MSGATITSLASPHLGIMMVKYNAALSNVLDMSARLDCEGH